jgi:tetratricopeptide (TPR) repeat protein
LKIQPNKELENKIKTLQAELGLEEGKSLAEQGKLDEALLALQRSIAFKETAEAKAELAKVNRSQKLGVLLSAGDTAAKKRDFKTAVQKYQEAAEIDGSDPEIQTNIKTCQYRLKVSEAQALIREKKYDEGRRALEECRGLLPDKAAEIDMMLDDMKQNRDYEQALVRGNENMKAKLWSKAREDFIVAQRIKDTPDVRTLIKETHYQENLEKGQALMESEQYTQARAYFNIAQKYNDTPEIRKLIDEADQKIKASPK